MKILKSGATPSAIVALSQKITRMSRDRNVDFLRLERGIPGVRPIDLESALPFIPFNTPQLQAYPPSTGREDLKSAVNASYFGGRSLPERIIVTPGGSMGLDIAFQILDVDKVFLPEFHWGTYRKILKTRNRNWGYYSSLEECADRPERFTGSAVVICDPDNPLGSLQPQGRVIEAAAKLGAAGAAVLVDCPYRRLFLDPSDGFYADLAALENTVIVESFSKSLGLSGLRVGFVHASDPGFLSEFSLRLALPTNGVDNVAQAFVEHFLARPEGMAAAEAYRSATAEHTAKNLAFLETRRLLASKFYRNAKCLGIFAAVNRSPEELLESRIGAIDLAAFTETRKDQAAGCSRINIAVPHAALVAFFESHMERFPSGSAG